MSATAAAGEATSDSSISIRRLEPGDKSKGFFSLLSQLSPSPPLSDADFSNLVDDLDPDRQLILVAEDLSDKKIIATGSVFIEQKFLRGGAKCGHVEDVVVDSAARRRGLGKKIVDRLVEFTNEKGCYKVILDCTPELVKFYGTCGFEEKNVQMAAYFNH